MFIAFAGLRLEFDWYVVFEFTVFCVLIVLGLGGFTVTVALGVLFMCLA